MAGRRKEIHGKSIDSCQYVHQIVKLIYEGNSDNSVINQVYKKYNYKISLPTMVSFRNNFYPKRLEEMKKFSNEFNEQQTGRVKTFIDEATNQSEAIKKDLRELQEQVTEITERLDFNRKVSKIFMKSFERYVDRFDPNATTEYLKGDMSEEERTLALLIKNAGVEGQNAISSFLLTHDEVSLVRLLISLKEKMLKQRDILVSIHKDIFKGYRNYSILQELVYIFEKYNMIIIEEFFPEKDLMDKVKFAKVRKRIMNLYEELQLRYQGVDTPEKAYTDVDAEVSIGNSSDDTLGLDAEESPNPNPNPNPNPEQDSLTKTTTFLNKVAEQIPTDSVDAKVKADLSNM